MPLPTDLVSRLADDTLAVVPDGFSGVALPGRRFVAEGEVAWDCELLAVQVERIYSGRPGLEEIAVVQAQRSSGLVLTANLAIWIVRCSAPVVDDGAVTDDALTESAHVLLSDSVRVWNALLDAFRDGSYAGCQGLAFREWSSAGPEGGFMASITRVAVQLTEA